MTSKWFNFQIPSRTEPEYHILITFPLLPFTRTNSLSARIDRPNNSIDRCAIDINCSNCLSKCNIIDF